MRVALTSVHSWPDVRRGGERYAHELAAALSRAGHRVQLLSTGSAPGRGAELGVPVHRLPVRRVPRRDYPHSWQDLSVEAAFGAQAAAHLGPALLAGRIDVWHATSTGDGAAAALAGRVAARVRPHVRTVFTDHGFPARRSREARPDRRLHSLVTAHIGAYVCVSQAAAGHLQSDYGRVADVVPPGVRLDAHIPATRRHPQPVLLYAGSLVEERKGLPLLLEAVALLRSSYPSLELWLLGQGDAGPLLAAAPPAARAAVTRCASLPDDQLRTAYAAAWATVLPSRAESFGMTVVESLASGTPAVVLTDGGGPPEIVDSDAVGRRAEGSPGALAAACAEVLELAAASGTVDACRARAADFDWDAAVVPALERVYEQARP
jgi:phosphatidylinositol alpha-mannosyltransferase